MVQGCGWVYRTRQADTCACVSRVTPPRHRNGKIIVYCTSASDPPEVLQTEFRRSHPGHEGSGAPGKVFQVPRTRSPSHHFEFAQGKADEAEIDPQVL